MNADAVVGVGGTSSAIAGRQQRSAAAVEVRRVCYAETRQFHPLLRCQWSGANNAEKGAQGSNFLSSSPFAQTVRLRTVCVPVERSAGTIGSGRAVHSAARQGGDRGERDDVEGRRGW